MSGYSVVRSPRKTLCVTVKRDGRVEVRAPLNVPESEIGKFVSLHMQWIEKRRKAVCEKPAFESVDTERLRMLAKQYIPQRAAHYARIMGVEYGGVKITSAKTRFGSCSGKNSLCFSLYLMTYPKQAVDAVIVHELAHIRQKNHSAAFYAEVDRVMPDYAERKKLLKNGIL